MSVCLAVRESEDGGAVHAARGTCLLVCVCGTGPYEGEGGDCPGALHIGGRHFRPPVNNLRGAGRRGGGRASFRSLPRGATISDMTKRRSAT